MSTWRPAREDELIFYNGSYEGDGVVYLGGIEAPSLLEVFLETEAPNVRVTALSYEELDTASGIEQGSMYEAARLAVVDMVNDPEIYNLVFGDASGNLAAGQLPPVMEWHDSENQVEAAAYGTYVEISPMRYSGDYIAPVGWFVRLRIEFDDGDDDGGGGGGGGECFWTDLTRVVQLCGNEPPPAPAGISVVGADMHGYKNVDVGSMHWEGGNSPTFLEGDYVPAEPINVLAYLTDVPQNVLDYCGVMNSAGIAGDRIVVANQTLGCGSYFYSRSSNITGSWKALLPPKSVKQNPAQNGVISASIFAVGTASAGGQLTSPTIFLSLSQVDDTSVSPGSYVQFNPPMQSTVTISEAESASMFGVFDELVDAGEMCVTTAANGYDWAGGAGNFSVDCQLFIRPPVYNVRAGTVTDLVFYRGATISVDGSTITVMGAGDPVPGVFDGVTVDVYENAYQDVDGTTYRYGHYFALPNDRAWGDYSQDEGVVVGDLYRADSVDGPQTFVGKVAFKTSGGDY